MMLYLMRHGEAASVQDDPEQGLTTEGKNQIEKLAQRLSDEGLKFSDVFHSEKTRARQTAEIMRDFIAPDIKTTTHLHIKPNDDPALIISEINHFTENTLITSHLPFVPNLIFTLTGKLPEGINFVPGTVVCLEKIHNSAWTIRWAISP